MQAFQAAKGLPVDGTVHDDGWVVLTQEAVPDIEARALQLTSSFEGHGYTLAQGNWDGAWITWGIIGFTLRHGEIQKIVRRIQEIAPDCVSNAFGAQAPELLAMMDAAPAEQEAWSDRISTGARLAEPWRTHFHCFGSMPAVQEEQRARAHRDYFTPALRTAADFGLTSALGIALCFDIQVQNGGVALSVGQAVRPLVGSATESQVREALGDAVAEHAKPEFREDVRSRKLAIARGSGTVHGIAVTLANWGLTDMSVTV